MRFGFFDQLPLADRQSESQRYQDILAQIELGHEGAQLVVGNVGVNGHAASCALVCC